MSRVVCRPVRNAPPSLPSRTWGSGRSPPSGVQGQSPWPSLRIIAGTLRGRTLVAPAGYVTRPTALRMRQALFDMLMHAPWGGRNLMDGLSVLDAFAGTGAFGLEALSRGAGSATFMESDAAALAALRANVVACRSEARARVVATDVLKPPKGHAQGLVFLDPPYAAGVVPASLAALRSAGWMAPGTLVVAETARTDMFVPAGTVLGERAHGAAHMTIWRED
jgi:16S rRNA (guanine966-N2)-methyltransferase